MPRIPSKLVTIIALIVLSGTTVGLPATVHAAQDLDPAQCASKKVTCNKKKDGGQNGSQPAQNATTPAQGAACAGFNQIGSGVSCGEDNGGNAGQSVIGNTVSTVVSVLSYVAGILGIIFIMLAGFRYITSGGDQNRVAGAKTTLIYAIAGLAVAALAQILVHFVLSSASGV